MFTAKDGSVFDRALIHPDRNDFAPRVGVAWSATPAVVLRGGYGVFYQQTDRYGSESQLGLNLPQLVDASITANSAADAPAFTFAQGFTPLTPQTVNRPSCSGASRIRTRTRRSCSSSASAPSSSSPTTWWRRRVRRQPHAQRAPAAQPQRRHHHRQHRSSFPYAQYGYGNAFLEQIVTNGRADYDALQMRMQRRMSGGLAVHGRLHVEQGARRLPGSPERRRRRHRQRARIAYEMDKDYGPLAFDIPHRFVTSFIYELPFGPGRTYEPDGVVGAIASDWSVNGILTLSDGRPFTVTTTDQAQTGPGRIARANCVGDAVPDGFDQTLDAWMDPAAFAPTTVRTYGNCAEQHRARAGLEVDEPVALPLDRPRRRQARRSSASRRSTCSTG